MPLSFKLRVAANGALEVSVNDGQPVVVAAEQVPTFLGTVPDAQLRAVLGRMVEAARQEVGTWQTLSTGPEERP